MALVRDTNGSCPTVYLLQMPPTDSYHLPPTLEPHLPRYKKGSHPKGRNVFLKDAESFIKWLEEAEEDEEADD